MSQFVRASEIIHQNSFSSNFLKTKGVAHDIIIRMSSGFTIRIKDSLYQIIAALIILMLSVGLAYLIEDFFHLSKGWYFFVCLNIIYVLVVTKFSLPILRKLQAKKAGIILLICIQLAFVSLMFIVFYSKLLASPERGLLLWAVMVSGLATITVLLFIAVIKKREKKDKAFRVET
jgi:hypothetical protein